ncbi:MAG: type II toxin-antitoxin system VapB family antitoxin [Propionibacteriaceae bacterium]|nr:type II toxin-antitoxin system VapB family antitoxin [Propionibacteriaceae bacterium]
MALNIKNERVCLLARQAAQRAGTSQVEALEHALEDFLAKMPGPDNADERRARLLDSALEEFYTSLSEEDRSVIRLAANDMYDPDGLPR